MNRPNLESLNNELFNAIDTQEAASVIGAVASKVTTSGSVTGGPSGTDWSVDGDYNF